MPAISSPASSAMWRGSKSDPDPAPPAMTMGLVLSPVALIAARRWWPYWRRRDVFVGLLAGWVVTLGMVRLGLFPHVLLYDLVTQWGAPAAGNLLGDRPKLFGDEAWSLFAVIALVATVLLGGVIGGIAGVHVRRARANPAGIRRSLGSPPGLLLVYGVFVLAGLSLFGLVGWLFDRYLWPVIPPLAALLLYVPADLVDEAPGSARGRRDRRRAVPPLIRRAALPAAAVCLVVLAVMSAGFLLNTNAYDGARWRAAERLVGRGFTPATVDAGPEWTDSHQAGLAIVTTPLDGLKSWHKWWHKSWPDLHVCAYVASSDFRTPGASRSRSTPRRIACSCSPAHPRRSTRMRSLHPSALGPRPARSGCVRPRRGRARATMTHMDKPNRAERRKNKFGGGRATEHGGWPTHQPNPVFGAEAPTDEPGADGTPDAEVEPVSAAPRAAAARASRAAAKPSETSEG